MVLRLCKEVECTQEVGEVEMGAARRLCTHIHAQEVEGEGEGGLAAYTSEETSRRESRMMVLPC